MIFISHRGNINGKNISLENKPEYIDQALSKGFQVEIDVRLVKEKIFLGHDTPDYEIDLKWIYDRKEKLWIHAKNLHCLDFFSKQPMHEYKFFWHQEDTYTLTSNNIIWAYPGSKLTNRTIAVMPELVNYDKQQMSICYGICSDFILKYKENK